jgi:hypothetical protein
MARFRSALNTGERMGYDTQKGSGWSQFVQADEQIDLSACTVEEYKEYGKEIGKKNYKTPKAQADFTEGWEKAVEGLLNIYGEKAFKQVGREQNEVYASAEHFETSSLNTSETGLKIEEWANLPTDITTACLEWCVEIRNFYTSLTDSEHFFKGSEEEAAKEGLDSLIEAQSLYPYVLDVLVVNRDDHSHIAIEGRLEDILPNEEAHELYPDTLDFRQGELFKIAQARIADCQKVANTKGENSLTKKQDLLAAQAKQDKEETEQRMQEFRQECDNYQEFLIENEWGKLQALPSYVQRFQAIYEQVHCVDCKSVTCACHL